MSCRVSTTQHKLHVQYSKSILIFSLVRVFDHINQIEENRRSNEKLSSKLKLALKKFTVLENQP